MTQKKTAILREAHKKFEEILTVKGLDFAWDGKKYNTVNIQTKWRYFALGYLSKRTAPEVLIDAIRLVSQKKRFIDPVIAQRMAMQDLDGDESPIEKLSPREFEVFIQLARGQSVQQISETLKLSASTVGTHLYKVKQKLQLANQSEITLLAMQHGLLDAGNP